MEDAGGLLPTNHVTPVTKDRPVFQLGKSYICLVNDDWKICRYILKWFWPGCQSLPRPSLKLHWCNHCSKVNNQHPPLSSDLHIPSFKIQIQLVTLLKIHKKEQRKYLFLFCALTLSVIIASTDAGFGHNFYIYYSQIISLESIVICYHFQDYLNISTRFCSWVFWICWKIIPNHWYIYDFK